MKKFFLALLSIFILIGGGILAACGSQVTTLRLSQDSVSIEILNDDPDGGYKIITAEVSGASDTSVRASTVSGYENIIQVSSQPTTGGKNQITIRGLTEGYAEFIVRTTQGNVYRVVGVDVYSTVSEMEQKIEDGNKTKNYLIRGKENTLIEENLINFLPSSKSRREITWSLKDSLEGLSINGNILSIDRSFNQNEITLVATTEKGVSVEIILPVIDAIQDESATLNLYWSYSNNTDFQKITGKRDESQPDYVANNTFNIVPNLPNDSNYEAYVYIDYTGDLEVNGYVLDQNNTITQDVEVSRQENYDTNKPKFKISANKDMVNLNGTYKLYFEIGYENYDYKISTLDETPIKLVVREKVNKINISTQDTYDLAGKTQIIYSNYAISKERGEQLNVSVLPTTVIGKTDKYSISVKLTTVPSESIVPEGECPVEFWYKNIANNTWNEVVLIYQDGQFKSTVPVAAETIYIKANENLLVQSFEGVEVSFTSEDNSEISAKFNVKLVRSVSEQEFVFENPDFRVDSSERVEDVIITKRFTLHGQSDLEGIYLKNNSEHVALKTQFYSSDGESVTFDVILTLNRNSFGVTQTDTYQIAHENGLGLDKEYKIEIFLPLKSVGVIYDNSTSSNSVTNYSYTDKMYDDDCNVVETTMQSLGSLMLKNNTNTPLLYQYNTSSAKSAVADINVRYLDYSSEGIQGKYATLEEFKALQIEDPAYLINIFAAENTKTSNIVSVSNDKSLISTKGVGFTYAIFKFTGKGVETNTIELYRIVLVESYISPEGLSVNPQKDKQVVLFANDSVTSTNTIDETKKRVTIIFDNYNTTYHDINNFSFVSTTKDSNGNAIMGNAVQTDTAINWPEGRYNITNIVIGDYFISFDINALSTLGEYAFSDELNVHYVLKAGDNVYYDIYTRVDILIKNAQRVESLVWVNSNDEGINFKVGETNPHYMIFSTNPTNAKNLNLTTIITNENGEVTNSFVTTTQDSSNPSAIGINLSSSIQEGMKGYIYILPQDAIYDGQIKYYIEGSEQLNTISASKLGEKYNSSKTWYQYLVENAHFISNATVSNDKKQVSFRDILLRVEVEVDDGKSFDYAYRVYELEDFYTTNLNNPFDESYFNPNLYYTVMRNIDFPETISINEFSGGIQGKTSDITLTLHKPFATTNAGIIQNITFIGNVEGRAFIAETNNGTISNVTIDTNGTYASKLTCNLTGSLVGGITGSNTGSITKSKVLGLTIAANGCTVGGIAGQNQGNISECLVEFYNLETTLPNATNRTYGPNTFTGGTVGAIVGAEVGGSVSDCYAYKYIDQQVLFSGNEPEYVEPSISSVEDFTIKTHQKNGYYKSIAVDSTNGMLFFYDIANNGNNLTSTEERDLKDLNTIMLSDLIEQNNVDGVIVSSSDINILSVFGNALYVKNTGTVTLTIYSKQNVEVNKSFTLKIINPITKLKISWMDGLGVHEVKDNTQIAVQKTKTRTFNVVYSITDVLLGNLANRYQLVLADYQLMADVTPSIVDGVSVLNNGVVLSSTFSVSSKGEQPATINVKYSGEDLYTQALNEVFAREFIINPIDGVIEFNLSEENLPITPSANGSVRVRISTTADDDKITPHILDKNDTELSIVNDEESGNIKYYLPTDLENPIIEVKILPISSETTEGINTYVYDVNFAVSSKFSVKEDMVFNVYFESESGSSSRYQNGGVFELSITRQKFTNIDITNIKIQGSQYKRLESTSEYVTFHTLGSQTAILAPGTSSVLRVNINPEYAFYDYMELTYSGAAVIDAVMLEYLKPIIIDGESGFIREEQNVNVIGSTLRYTPTALTQALYFKVWVNTTVNTNTVIKFTASFYSNDSQERITYANYYLSVSYLKEPIITIDGQQTAYVAKGSTSNIEFVVLEDQVLDAIELVGENISGIEILNFTDLGIDSEKGIRKYTALLQTSVLAKADNNVVYVQGKVSRYINGSLETKTAIATAKIVDFKIDTDNINVKGAENGSYEVWLGVPKAFEVEYNLIPESYSYAQNDDSVIEVQKLLGYRNQFLRDQYYSNPTSNFYINYEEVDGQMVAKTIYDRLFYVSGSTAISVKDQSENRPIRFVYDENSKMLTVTGKKLGETAQLKLETYVYADNVKTVYTKYFTVTVTAYSDEDIPLTISNTEEFLALKPDSNNNTTTTNSYDYILTNNILLENYDAFATTKIKSLDGNGYTIFIKSFNVEPENTTTLNLALFTTVREFTTLKNVRVNLYNGGQITVDKSVYKNINIAGLAVSNEGIIYNSEVVSFYSENLVPLTETLNGYACTRHSNPTGINVKYINGKNTSDPVYISDGSNWTTRVAGFVLENSGSITNSRLGGDEITLIGDGTSINTSATKQKLSTFYINGQGNMAGFVLENSGSIASSFVKNIDMENKSNTTRYYLAGFVGNNYSTIITSYVEGVLLDGYSTDEDSFDGFVREGSSLKSSLGYIAGFNYSNSGDVKDSYSNILISNSGENQEVYLVSGFVYENTGDLYNCFSASQISNARYTQMNFSGVDEEGNLLSSGSYTNCYYFNIDYASVEDFHDNSTESQFNTGAIIIGNPKISSNFYGFAIASTKESNDGIWYLDEDTGMTLIPTNTISLSHRYQNYIDEQTAAQSEQFYGQDKNGKYTLPYATLIYQEDNKAVNTELGSSINPIIISDAQTLVKATGTSSSTVVKQYFKDGKVTGNYRIVNNIVLSDLVTSEDAIILPSTSKVLTGKIDGTRKIDGGKIDGNGFTISNLSTTSKESGVGYGLFASMDGATVINLNLKITQVGAGSISMVGGLAGFVNDSRLININVEFNGEAGVTGLNFAGGLVGAAFGSTIMNNIVVNNPIVKANKIPTSDTQYFDVEKIATLRSKLNNGELDSRSVDYSYAGGLVGYVDCFASVNQTRFEYNPQASISINNVRVNGEVFIRASVAGGIFGLTSYSTVIKDAGITIAGTTSSNSSKILGTDFFAGGVVGQSYGSLDRIFARYEQDTQNAIENNIATFYQNENATVERGATDIFYTKDGDYKQKYVGGLVGFAQSGALTISYSKLNVIGLTADYAGGIFGGVDVSKAASYTFTVTVTQNNTKKINTQYVLHEVYATGDVRAKVFAGGIFGAIKKTKGESLSKVSLYNVNALNYISNYDYENETYLEINGQQTNLSANLKVNLIVGHLIDGETVVNPSVLAGNADLYTSFFRLVQKTDTAEGNPTFGFYQNYTYSNQYPIYINLFGEISNNITNNALYTSKLIFAITGPAGYTSAQTGHLYTQNAFLNSEVWDANNWIHDSVDLFPQIRYAINFEVLYLDQFNVKDVFREMSNSGSYTKVVVRGLVSEGGTEFGDITIDASGTGDDGSISKFSGAFVGTSLYKTSEGKQVKIKSNRNFISSVGPGFVARNLIIDYSGCKNIEQGLFINSAVESISIKNLTMTVGNIKVQSATSINNVGLVAPVITNSSINKLTINNSNSNPAILTIENTTDNQINIAADNQGHAELNVGLIAGTLGQSSAIEIKRIENISLPTDDSGIVNTISIGNTSATEYNVGTYFGKVQVSTNENNAIVQDLKLNISDLNSQIMFTGLNGPTLNVGGYIGYAESINNLTIMPLNDSTVKVKHVTKFTGSNAIEGLNHGLFVGKAELSSSIALSNNGANPKGGLYAGPNTTISALNAGGIYGHVKKGLASVSGFGSINYEVAGLENDTNTNIVTNYLSANSFEDDYSNNKNFMLKAKNANVGVVVGQAESSFSFDGNSKGTSLNKALIGETADSTLQKCNSFRIQVDETANIGSVIGLATAGVTITGSVNSDLQVLVVEPNNKDATLNFGGMVGQVSTDTPNVQIGSYGGVMAYSGGVFSNVKTVNFGGLLGSFYESAPNNGSVTLRNAQFSGALKVFGVNSNNGSIYAGGVVGNIDSNQDKVQAGVTIIGNKLWGDVFVEYNSSLKCLNEYYFGGIIGKTKAFKSNTTPKLLIVGGESNDEFNISAMTSHNARYEDKSNTAHALFGSGVSSNDNIKNNYYSHSIALLTDDNGIDCGYAVEYKQLNQGYDTCDVKANNDGTISKGTSIISRFIDITTSLGEGHKLNPASLTESGTAFNGITYYKLENDVTTNTTIDKGQNFAIIGDGIEHEYVYTTATKNVFAPIKSLSGYSFVSSVLLNVNINIDSEEGEKKDYAGLIGEMGGNSILFASQVKGNIEVGSTGNSANSQQHNVSGLVGKLTSGKISNCSTDVDIIYRAEQGGSAYGFAQMGDGNVLNRIENSYSAGSISTYIDANIHAFTQGSANSHVNNSYTITRIFWDDYTVENPAHEDTVITAFGSSNSSNTAISDYKINNCYYDADALGDLYAKYIDNADGNEEKNRTLYGSNSQPIASSVNGENGNFPWTEGNLDFNYGYPTLKIGYLKVSSYAIRDDYIESSEENYDKYVKEYSYTRLPNNTSPTNENNKLVYDRGQVDKDAYFHLVNKGVVSKVSDVSANYILPYDINTTSMFGSWTFTGKFDGCGHTVSGLTNRFFDKISDADVRNVRIVDFYSLNGDNKVDFNTSGILADTIKNATISNLVVKGIMTVGKEASDITYDLGAIANTITGSEINTTTNMTQFKVTASSDVNVGGFAGYSKSTMFRYCSNYGNINVEQTEHTGIHIEAAGGIVGYAGEKSTISYSYNAASVIVGYTEQTTTATTSLIQSYVAGGLVGYAYLQGTQDPVNIDNSYNAGMIKAGNKYNVRDNAQEGLDKGGQAYAGGIVAYGNKVNILNCFNEGTIEALGKNPGYKFVWRATETESVKYPNGSSSNQTKYKDTEISLVQTSNRNVWAYGIGYCGDSSSIENVQSIKGYENIFNNGSYKKIGGTIYTIDFVIDDQATKKIEGMELTDDWSDHHYRLGLWTKNWFNIKGVYLNNVENVYVKSVDSLGLPNCLTVETEKVYSYNYYYQTQDASHGRNDIDSVTDKQTEYVQKTYSDSLSKYFDQCKFTYAKDTTEFGDKEFTDDKTQSSIKSSTRSQYELTGDDVNNSVKTIAGTQYYFVDKNNSSQIFNAGISTDEIEFDLINNSMPYVADPSYYEVTVNSIGGDTNHTISAKITNVTDEKLTISLISPNNISGDVKYTVTCTYAEKTELSVENLKYIYTNDYSYGVLVGDKDFTDNIYAGATLTYSEGPTDSYSKVIKASTVDYGAQNAPTAPTEGDNSYIYFAYDEPNNMLIYIPNASLKRGNLYEESGITVNETPDNQKLDPDNFKNNIENSINWLKSQTLYLRTKTSSTETTYITSKTDSISQQTFTVAKQTLSEDTTRGTLEYGANINPVISSSGNYPTVTATDTFTIDGTLQFNLSVSGATDGSQIKKGNLTIAEYNSGVWNINVVTNTVPIGNDDLEFAISQVDGGTDLALTHTFNSFELENITLNSVVSELQSIIAGWSVTNGGTLSVSVSNLSTLTITSTLHKIDVTIDPGKEAIALDSDNLPCFAYNGSTWSGIGELNLGDVEFNISSAGTTITLTYSDNTNADVKYAYDHLEDAVTYFNKLTYIVNKFNNTVSIYSPVVDLDTNQSGKQTTASQTYDNNNIKITYRAVNEKWNSHATTYDDGSLTYTIDSTSKNLTIGFNTDRTGLTAYTLNGVTIYKGSVAYTAEHDYEIEFTNLNIAQGKYDMSYWIIDKDVKDEHDDYESHSYGWIAHDDQHDYGIGLEYTKDFDGNSVSVTVDIFSTFDLGELDENEDYDFDLLLKNTSSNDYVAVTGTLAAGALTNIYKYSKLTAETFKEYVDYYIKDGNEYVKATEFNDTTPYYTYDFNSEGDDLEYIQVNDPKASDFSILYWKNNNDEFESVTCFDISKTYYTKNEENGQYVELLVPEAVTNETAIATLIKYDKGTTKHLYVSLEGYTSTIEESFGEYTSTFTKNKYTWEKYNLPEYQKQEWQASVITEGFNYEVEKYDANQYKVVSSTEEPTKVVVLLKKLGYESVTISSSKEDEKELEVSANKTVSVSSKLFALSIILTNDISFNKHEDINKAKGINVVGNGFNFTTIGQVYNYIYVNNTEFIRDINLLCENTTDSIFANEIKYVNQGTATLSLDGISLYGTLNNHTGWYTFNSTALVGGSSSDVSINVSSFNLYLNVNNYSHTTTLDDLYIFPTLSEAKDINNYGVIAAKDGKDSVSFGYQGGNGSSVIAAKNQYIKATSYSDSQTYYSYDSGTQTYTEATGVTANNFSEYYAAVVRNNRGIVKIGVGGNGFGAEDTYNYYKGDGASFSKANTSGTSAGSNGDLISFAGNKLVVRTAEQGKGGFSGHFMGGLVEEGSHTKFSGVTRDTLLVYDFNIYTLIPLVLGTDDKIVARTGKKENMIIAYRWRGHGFKGARKSWNCYPTNDKPGGTEHGPYGDGNEVFKNNWNEQENFRAMLNYAYNHCFDSNKNSHDSQKSTTENCNNSDITIN